MESQENSFPKKKLFSEFLISDEIPSHPKSNGLTLRIEGQERSTHLTEQQFRILMFLRKNQGNPVSVIEIEEFVYGDPEHDLPMSVGIQVQISALNRKLKSIQDTLRFVILNQRNSGYYLSDLQNPEMLRQGGEASLNTIVSGKYSHNNRNRRKGQ